MTFLANGKPSSHFANPNILVDASARQTNGVEVLRCSPPIASDTRAVPTATFQMLVVALVHSRLYYGNAVLVGIPAYLVHRLQSVLNTAA